MVQLSDNATIKVNGTAKMKVFKCPWVGCSFFSPSSYDEVTVHRINEHGDVPKFLQGGGEGGSGSSFTKGRIGRATMGSMMFRINTYKLMLELYLKEMGKKGGTNGE